MNYYAAHRSRMAAVQARLGTACPVIDWNEDTWQVIPGSALRKKDLAAGGYQMNADFQFEALVSTFVGAVFKDGDGADVTVQDAKSLKDGLLRTPIGYLGDEYEAALVRIREGGLQVLVECTSINQNG